MTAALRPPRSRGLAVAGLLAMIVPLEVSWVAAGADPTIAFEGAWFGTVGLLLVLGRPREPFGWLRGVAVMRDRLDEIDRIVSRTIGRAVSTAAILALFTLNRSRYGAERISARLAARLRDETDLPAIDAGIVESARAGVQPGSVSRWVWGQP